MLCYQLSVVFIGRHHIGVYPLLICLMGNETDVPAFEREMGDLAWDLAMAEGE